MQEGYLQANVAAERGQPYEAARIVAIWALATLPVAILSWIVFPALAPDFGADPLGAGVMRIVLLTIGLIWLFVFSMIIVGQEEGSLSPATLKRRLRLNVPQDPGTGETRGRLWLWLIVIIMASVLWDVALVSAVNQWWVSIFPIFAQPAGYDFAQVFESQVVLEKLEGQWWFLGLFVVSAIFNSILGEEFLFRGVLLPRMDGVFGRWSWTANGLLFGLYHVHQPWTIPGNVVSGALFLALPSWRFRSTWMAIIVHSVQNLFFGFLLLGVVLGQA